MLPLRSQHTITKPVVVTGFGYWSGQDIRVEFRPAPAGTGLVFVRKDIPSQPRIPALVANRIETPLRTTLVSHGVSVEMVEHVLAACAGLEVDNCEIWVDQPEMPGCDGSSQAFVDALTEAEIVAQDALRSRLVVTEVTRVGDEDSWVEIRPRPRGGFKVKYRLDYGSDNAIGRQTIELAVTPKTFRSELAAARTFLLESEAEWLRSRGLGTRVTTKDLVVFGDEGPIDNELRFEDECVRHKTLDLVGDFALAGCEIVGQVMAQRSGHRLNAELVRVLLAEGEIIGEQRRTA
ncbi:MAG: UDP-3-O-[3-hydroxymyristoyl] N-acetylglucosamine deacetylase [Planctomycetaceae bacterium]|nr:UDP-3-O-[3-hydroxymyristoyl] N-acetylglucosamine deacetylase [Planctomycetales bacterium]MCB9875861.1 UDP-3-O-[3-hydroxymyristoyl] N-acetylglucosamine deacetylase [Planctomycetaceae bacterium]MCB9938110.1 UDP-3-O-[3-hydroxymyristoyl] N-acetylglucosamine deacetylase [Planctomycetaceae bacterium]